MTRGGTQLRLCCLHPPSTEHRPPTAAATSRHSCHGVTHPKPPTVAARGAYPYHAHGDPTHRSVKNWPAGSKFETFISLLVDNIVHVPLIYVPTYFITVGAMQGETLSQSLGVLNSQWPAPAVTTSWAFWVPVMAMNFSIVPVAFRVQVVGVANFVWTVVLDYITHDAAAGGHGHARTVEQEGTARRASGEKESGGVAKGTSER